MIFHRFSPNQTYLSFHLPNTCAQDVKRKKKLKRINTEATVTHFPPLARPWHDFVARRSAAAYPSATLKFAGRPAVFSSFIRRSGSTERTFSFAYVCRGSCENIFYKKKICILGDFS